MKCEKCNFVSFEYNLTCPQCKKELGSVRSKLGIWYAAPEADFDQFFLGDSASFQTSGKRPAAQAEPPLSTSSASSSVATARDSVAIEDDFEFSLDD